MGSTDDDWMSVRRGRVTEHTHCDKSSIPLPTTTSSRPSFLLLLLPETPIPTLGIYTCTAKVYIGAAAIKALLLG